MLRRAFFTLLMLIIAGSAAASDFELSYSQVDGKIGTIIPADVNNDGQKDLVVSFSKGAPPNQLPKIAVFINGVNGPKQAPDFTISLPKDSCLFDLADFNNDKNLELVLFRKWSIYIYTLVGEKRGSSRKLLSKGSNLLFPPEDGLISYLDLARDWDGDQTEDLALLQFGAAKIYHVDSNLNTKQIGSVRLEIQGWMTAKTPEVEHKPGISLLGGYEMPMLFPIINKNGALIAVGLKDRIWLHKWQSGVLDEKGQLSAFTMLSNKEIQDGNMNLTNCLDDFNGDGLTDLALNKYGGSLTKFSSAVAIFSGNDKDFNSTPGYSFAMEGLVPTLFFMDINQDGKKEMFMPKIDIGLVQIARMFTSKSLKIRVDMYRGEDNFYPGDPIWSKTLIMGVNSDNGIRFIGYVPDFSGDFDNDGLPDLFMAHNIGFGVWKNNGDLTFSNSPFLKSEEIPEEHHRLADVNGDGRCDVLSWTGLKPDRRGRIRVLINKGN